MKSKKNLYSSLMSSDYGRLRRLMDDGFVVVCFVDYVFDTGGRRMVFRDVAKAKANDYNPNSKNYGYLLEARGIVYLSWDKRMSELRGVTFEGLCEDINVQFIDNYAEY